MTSKEFIIWLKGFTEGVHDFNITPKQWDLMKDKLAEVDDNTVPMGGVMTDPNTFRTVYPNWTGINPYETRGPETPTGTRITTTPGTTSITFTTGSGLGVGTTYTTNGAPNWYATYFADLNDKTND